MMLGLFGFSCLSLRIFRTRSQTHHTWPESAESRRCSISKLLGIVAASVLARRRKIPLYWAETPGQREHHYRADVSSLLGRLMGSFSAFAWVMFGVAAIVGTATLASSIAERSRAVTLARLVGGKRQTIRSLLGIEAMVTVTMAWLVAVLGAQLASRFSAACYRTRKCR
jgi:hypothetical protein